MVSKKLEDWPVKIIDGDRSSRYPKRNEMVNEGILFLSTPSIVEGSIDLSVSNFITQKKFDSISKGRLQNSDIVMTTRGTIGKLAFFKSSQKHPTGLINAQMLILRPDPEVIKPKYLFYLMGSEKYQTQMKSFSSGSAQPQIPITDLRKTVLSFPIVKTQDAVVEVIDSYTNLIENNNRRIAILEDMAQSLYREWFVNFRYPNHQDNLDADGKPKLIDSPLGQIPEGWEVVALEDLCNKITDGSHKSPRSVDVGVPMASVKDMHDFGINASKCRQISYEDYEDLKRQDSVVKANDILVAKDGSYLKHTFVVEKELEMALLSSIAIIRPNNKVKPHWLAYCLRSPLVKERMKNYVSGAAIPRIILKDFRKFNLFIPPKELMDEWNSIVERMVKQCWNLVARNENLKQQRDMLLPKLISGQIEFKD